MKQKTFLAVVALALSALLSLVILAACGGSPSTTSSSSYTVTMSGVTFDSNAISISKGSTITFTTEQSSGAAHNLVVGLNGKGSPEDGAADFGTGGQTVGPGKSWTTPPWNTAGSFHVTCTYHPTTMNLTVTVTG